MSVRLLLRIHLALQAGEGWLDLLFPPRCAGCGARGLPWCSSCECAVVRWPPGACALCGLARTHRPGCGAADPSTPIRSYAAYHGPVARALLHLKYRPNRALAGTLAGWLERLAAEEGWNPEVVVPVPLGEARRRGRGYNQVSLVAERLAGSVGAAFVPEALLRRRETRSQVGLDPERRRRNVAGAFQAWRDAVFDRRVLLVDDLTTTGATLLECARVLRQAGAITVHGMSVARPRRDSLRRHLRRGEGET